MPRFELQKLYIDGGYVEATSGKTFQTINPANGEVLADMQSASKKDVDLAIISAQAGQKIWGQLVYGSRQTRWRNTAAH